jgi:prepilin-type N-terminal cleavage/methylation domain-containing protein
VSRKVTGPSHEEGFTLALPVKRQAGFSLIEMVVALAVAVILLAVSLPIFLRAYHSYQLSSAARQLADILRLTRYEAIRLNKPVNCVIQPFSGDASMMSASMTDSSGNPLTGIGAATVLFGISGNLINPSGVPSVPAMLAASNIGSMPTQSWPTMASLTFDARGAVNPPTNVNVFYLASSVAPDAGYRAVLLMPAGSIQIWSGDATGDWEELR